MKKLDKIEVIRERRCFMRHKRMEIPETDHPHIEEISNTSPKVESAVMKLIVDGYLHGAQTCELHDGKILGVSIHHGACDNVHFFIDNNHKITVEVHQGMSRITVMKNKNIEDIEYILPFTKCFGVTEGQVMQNYSEE